MISDICIRTRSAPPVYDTLSTVSYVGKAWRTAHPNAGGYSWSRVLGESGARSAMSSAEMDDIMDEACEECAPDAYLDMPDKLTQDAILIVAQVRRQLPRPQFCPAMCSYHCHTSRAF